MTGITLNHGFGEVPTLVDVQVKSIEEPNKDFIFTGVGEYRRTGLRQTEPCLRARMVREKAKISMNRFVVIFYL